MSEYKNCPFCFEMIINEAIKCRYCQSILGEASKASITELSEVFYKDIGSLENIHSIPWLGGTYTGQVIDKKPHGNGKFKAPDGYIYECTWINGKKHGKGVMTYPTGAKYVGEWGDDQPLEGGKMFYPKTEALLISRTQIKSKIDDESNNHNANVGHQRIGKDNAVIDGLEDIKKPFWDEETKVTRPWVRYFARMTDYFTFAIIFGIVLVYISPYAFYSLIEFGIFATPVILCVWSFVEALLLSVFGTTLGKWLLSTSVEDIRGNKLAYAPALTRSFQVLFRGLGLGIFPINLVTLYIAYRTVTKSIFSRTTWDVEGEYKVRHERIKPIRVVLLVFIWIGIGFNVTF